MCDRDLPRFQSYYYQVIVNDSDTIPLEIWLENNIPDNYRVISIMMDKMVSYDIVINYHIVAEKI